MELLDGEVGVEFGVVEAFVAKELLDGAQVGSVVHHEGGDGVAEEMAGAFLFDACGLTALHLPCGRSRGVSVSASFGSFPWP